MVEYNAMYMWCCMLHPVLWVDPIAEITSIMAIFGVFLKRHALDVSHLKCIILFVDITSFNNAVMSYVTSQHHTCVGHMTVYYKRATNASVGGVTVSSSVR